MYCRFASSGRVIATATPIAPQTSTYDTASRLPVVPRSCGTSVSSVRSNVAQKSHGETATKSLTAGTTFGSMNWRYANGLYDSRLKADAVRKKSALASRAAAITPGRPNGSR